MTGKQIGPVEVRPNTLRDQMAPNTVRSTAAPGPPGAPRQLNQGGGSMARSGRMARPAVPLWLYVAIGILALVIALYLLQGVA